MKIPNQNLSVSMLRVLSGKKENLSEYKDSIIKCNKGLMTRKEFKNLVFADPTTTEPEIVLKDKIN